MSDLRPSCAAEDSSVTSLTLLRRLKSRNTDGWDLLVQKYGISVYRWCREGGLSEHDACDTSQEVFAAVSRKVHEFQVTQDRGGFKNWLYSITKHKIIDFWRTQQRRENVLGGSTWQDLLGNLAIPNSIDLSRSGPVAQHEWLNRVVESVRVEFSERDWQLFCRTVMDGASASVVAAEWGLPVNVVYLAKSRVLKLLRQRCQQFLRETS